MARAKQTNRAEARRRYRQAQAETAEGAPDDGEAAGGSAGSAVRSGSKAAPVRAGLVGAFRGAWHQPNYRADVADLPLLVRGRWFLISLGLVVLGFVAVVIAPGNVIALFAYETLTLPPAMVPIFLVGFTAPRASYLLGLVIGLVDVVLYLSYVAIASAQSGISVPIDEYLLSALAFGIPVAVVFAAAAAWYKRFLALQNPRRQQAGRSDRSKTARKAPARR